MKILFYRYGSICEPDLISTFQQVGIEVIEETSEMYHKSISPEESIDIIVKRITECRPLFLFSINFFPVVAEVCHTLCTPYICWTVDCPITELFSTALLHDTNRIFMFDHTQYTYYHPYNPDCIYYLPLAANTQRFDNVISSITPKDRMLYSSDISFVGSLYTEKNPMRQVTLSPYCAGYLSGIIDASLKVYGFNFIEEMITTPLIQELSSNFPNFVPSYDTITDPTRFLAAHCYLGMQAAETERIRTLNRLAEHFSVDLFTRSESNSLHNVNVHGGVKTLTEMPKIFHLSKINLNITIKPIQTGLPLRIFDIMGCGGFLMTNYQSELTDFFEIGTDLEAYSSLDELCDKSSYYLKHADIREKIALTGYQKIKKYHSYHNRILLMLKTITE